MSTPPLIGSNAATRSQNDKVSAVIGATARIDDLDLHTLVPGRSVGPLELKALAAVLRPLGHGEAVAEILTNRHWRVAGTQITVAARATGAGTLLVLALRPA